MISLVRPDTRFKKAYLEMLEAWEVAFEDPEPWVLREDATDFLSLVDLLNGYAEGKNIPVGYHASMTYWVYDDERDTLIGAVSIRPELNVFQAKYGGNIGYGVRPDERGKGFAKEILAQALSKSRELGLSKILLCCYRDNKASERVILHNGGVLESEVQSEETGRVIRRYWITV